MRSEVATVSALALVLICGSFGDVAEAAEPVQGAGIAYLRVASGPTASDPYENYCAYLDPRVARNLSDHYRLMSGRHLADLYPSNGCAHSNASYIGRTVIVARGGCDFTEKAVLAYAQGASGLIVVSSERYPAYILVQSPLLPANYQVALVSKVAYQSMKHFFSWSAVAGLYRPLDESGSKQYAFFILYGVAVVTMVMSCIAAATALKQHLLTRARQAMSSLNGETELDSGSSNCWQTIVFSAVLIAVPITILLLLNFAYDYTVWVMLVLYGYSVASSVVYYANRVYLAAVQARIESGPRPWLATTVELDLGKCCGKISYTYLEFIAYPFGIAMAVFWFVFRNAHWAFILTNLLNVILVMRVIESLAMMTRIKMATILLACFLVYDVFFVFITPLFSGGGGGGQQPPLPPTMAPTLAPPAGVGLSRVRRDTAMDFYVDRGGSIMERVALGTAGMSGEIIPIVFKVMQYPPAESINTCLLPYSILGLGDVILPAMLLSLNLFFDLAWSNRLWPYFCSSLVGYLLGLGACAAVLFATGKGQPALLYIVPLILIASYICAAIRKELKLYFYTRLPDEYQAVAGFEVDGGGASGRQANGEEDQQRGSTLSPSGAGGAAGKTAESSLHTVG